MADLAPGPQIPEQGSLTGRSGLERFLSEFRFNSLARTNRFNVVVIPPPVLAGGDYPMNMINLYCEQANLPLVNVTTKPYKIFGPAYQRPISSEYGGEGISMTFHIDRDMRLKRFFEDWVHSIVDPDSFLVSYQEDYVTTIAIEQLDEEENVTYAIELLEAFPRSLNLVELNNGSQNQTHRLNVLFAYRKWVRTI